MRTPRPAANPAPAPPAASHAHSPRSATPFAPFSIGLLIATAVGLGGCVASSPSPDAAGTPESDVQVSIEPGVAAAYERMGDAMARGGHSAGYGTGYGGADPFAPRPGDSAVRWLDVNPSRDTRRPDTSLDDIEHRIADRNNGQDNATTTTQTPTDPAPPHATTATTAIANTPLATRPLTRRELVNQLLAELKATHAPAMRQALAAVVATTLNHGRAPADFDERFLEPLSDEQRRAVLRYRDLLSELNDALAATDADGVPLAGDLLDRHLGDVSADKPVAIRHAELCTRVDGYGVYQPFPTTTFVAGRPHRMIVYTELDDFQSTKDGAFYRVKLRQEVELYNETDGLIVWRQPAEEITDPSRNRRRDFFVVQMVELPANLTVGRYRLGVRITDLADDSQDEFKLPIQIVADDAIARGE